MQSKLLAYGYDTPQPGVLDVQATAVVSALQMHFRPARYDGVPDEQTCVLLNALLEKYFRQVRSPSSQRTPFDRSPQSTDERGGDVSPVPAAR